jgi:hypothetical protein
MASLSTMKAQSECSSVVWVVRMELYGSTTAVATYAKTRSKFFRLESVTITVNNCG